VVNKVVLQYFGKRGLKLVAAANSAARLLGGKTMHSAAKLTRKQALNAKALKPNSRCRKALETEWEQLVFLLGDEIGLANPRLLAGLSRRASYGRRDLYDLDMKKLIEQPFGQVLVQVLMGDFMQINPVKSHTLLEALLTKASVPGVPQNTTDEDTDGYNVFRKVLDDVVLFRGTHRFKDKELPRLFECLRKKGGGLCPLTSSAASKIKSRKDRKTLG
jgi:hypothetical protein